MKEHHTSPRKNTRFLLQISPNKLIFELRTRAWRNYENDNGIAYPNKKRMRAYSSLCNADNWATRREQAQINETVHHLWQITRHSCSELANGLDQIALPNVLQIHQQTGGHLFCLPVSTLLKWVSCHGSRLKNNWWNFSFCFPFYSFEY